MAAPAVAGKNRVATSVLIASPLPTTLAGAVLHALADVTCSKRKHRCARLHRAASVEIGIRA